MKNFLKTFIHQPKKVITVCLVLAVIIGTFGYINIHKIPADKFTENSGISDVKNVSLSFPTDGKVKSILVKTGDNVKKGQLLATIEADKKDGSFTQAEALYETANANYQKVINGATGASVDFAKSVVNTAQVNLNEVTKQQQTIVDNAHRTLLNSTLEVKSVGNYDAYDAPVVSGTYECGEEGTYDIKTYSSTGGMSVNYSGIESGSLLLTDLPRAMGKCGLYLSFSKTKDIYSNIDFKIEIPNKSAGNYNVNNNAYQLALQNKEQVIASAKAALDQANASLNVVVTNARPEDVMAAKAQVESAYGALMANPGYSNTVILAPTDGIITDIHIKEGQAITSNIPAIEFLGLFN
jgi:multidrug resistance efflux pump